MTVISLTTSIVPSLCPSCLLFFFRKPLPIEITIVPRGRHPRWIGPQASPVFKLAPMVVQRARKCRWLSSSSCEFGVE